MKMVKLLRMLLFPVVIFLSCSTSKNKQDNDLTKAESILSYKDSIDERIPSLKVQKSLPYSVGDYTFLIIKYSHKNHPILLVEQGTSAENGSREKRYYLKNGKLLLYTERASRGLQSKPYLEKRAFYNDGLQFAAEVKKLTETRHQTNAFFQNTEPLIVDVKTALKRCEQALNQTGQFDLCFDEIIEYPKARYIVLGHPDLNPYRSALLILKQDNFINELINNPVNYRGRKLKMKWEKRNNEFVYVSGGFK